ncbi:MAG: FadR family transcriptional regulator [Firmicutes bacterium]|nr:FadR family transcriptional regulator [Bacillota bacterium]
MLKPLKRKTLAEEIIHSIRELIANGELKPGDKLPGERELAEQLCVSRACVREALRALALAGVLSIRPGDGTYLNENTSQYFSDILNTKLNFMLETNDFVQLIEARKIIESQLAKLAAKRATQEMISILEDSVIKMEKYFDDLETFIREDVKFHVTISEAAENEILFQTLSTVRELLTDVQRAVSQIEGLRPRSLKYHKKIYECVRDRKFEEAARVMDEHISDVERTLWEYLETKKC